MWYDRDIIGYSREYSGSIDLNINKWDLTMKTNRL
jgi:hypothetical protein